MTSCNAVIYMHNPDSFQASGQVSIGDVITAVNGIGGTWQNVMMVTDRETKAKCV